MSGGLIRSEHEGFDQAMTTPTDPLVSELDVLRRERDRYVKSHAETYELFLEKVEDLSLIRRVSDALRNVIERHAMSRSILEIVAEEVAPQRVYLFLADRDSLFLVAQKDVHQDTAVQIYSGVSAQEVENDSLVTTVHVTEVAQLLPAIAPEARLKIGIRDSAEVGSLILLPLMGAECSLGVLLLTHTQRNFFEPKHERTLAIISNTIATSLKSILMFEEKIRVERALLHSDKLASLGRLVAGVAHEIGNPLGSLLGYAQILKRERETPEERREYVLAIEELAQRMRNILAELLNFSRPSPVKFDLVDLGDSVKKVIGFLAAQKTFRQIMISVDLPSGGERLQVWCAREQIEQVFLNILINAADAMPDGGVLSIVGRSHDDVVRLQFSDQGAGIPAEQLDRIFEPFFTTKAEGKGTGLGLAVAARIVEKCRGTIQVESEIGKGTTFYLSFPHGAAGQGAHGQLTGC